MRCGKKKYIKFKTILIITWMDSMSWDGWRYGQTAMQGIVEDNDFKNHKTVGFYLGETKESITLVQSFGRDEVFGSNFYKIPKACIQTIKLLK